VLTVCFTPTMFTLTMMLVLAAGSLSGFFIAALFCIGGRT
jgi:hypothetical protein